MYFLANVMAYVAFLLIYPHIYCNIYTLIYIYI